MKGDSNNLSAYPPPPPPPAKGSRKTLIAAAIIAVLAVAAIGGAYMLMSIGSKPSSNSTSPSATQTTQPAMGATGSPPTSQAVSPSATPGLVSNTPQPTLSSGSNQQGANKFRAGAWANYTYKGYVHGTLSQEDHWMVRVDEGSYEGVDCWVLTMETENLLGHEFLAGIITKDVLYLSKNTMEGIRVEKYENNQLNAGYSYDLNDTNQQVALFWTGGFIPNSVIGSESVTVAAGTFENCVKSQTTNEQLQYFGMASGTTSYAWVHSSVPIWGLVKNESYRGEELEGVTELTAYGG